MKKAGRAVLLAILGGFVILSLTVQVTHEAEGHSQSPAWESLPGFYILLGFLGSLALVGLGLGLGKFLTAKKEPYPDYD